MGKKSNKEKLAAILADSYEDPNEIKVRRLDARLREAKALLKASHKREILLRDHLDHIMAVGEHVPKKTIKAPRRRTKKRKACAVLLCSDWHIEEVVEPEQIGGYANTYNPEIAEKRVNRIAEGAVALINHHESGIFEIPDLLVWWGGDHITGFLRDEDKETNALAPIPASLFFFDLAVAQLKYLLKHTSCNITVVVNSGNHARTTDKVQHRNEAEMSLEWMVATLVARLFEDEPRVTFIIEKSALTYVDVYGLKLRFHHGHHIKYKQGVMGLGVPAGKKIAGWDKSIRADLTCIGHYHQLGYYPSLVTNGSAIGYNPYGQSLGVAPEVPQQAMFLIDSKRGVCCRDAIWLT